MRQDRFDRMFAEHADGLFGFLAYRTGDHTLAEDLVAETFERALRARRTFDPRRGREKAWLYSIALNLLRDRMRRAETERRALEDVRAQVVAGGAAPEIGDLVADRDALTRALTNLSDEEREAVSLRYGADLSMAEVARVTGQKLGTAEGRVYRALEKLRAELG